MTNHLLIGALVVLNLIAAAGAHAQPADSTYGGDVYHLPVELLAHQFIARPVTIAGDTLSFFLDTGGGTWISRDAVDVLELPVITSGISPRGDTLYYSRFPEFIPEASIPLPHDNSIFVLSLSSVPSEMLEMTRMDTWHGMLGSSWFDGRIWTFDYARERLLLHRIPPSPMERSKTAALHFAHNGDIPRILQRAPIVKAEVDGDTLGFIFDIGATVSLSDSAVAVLNDGVGSVRAASFISDAMASRWREKHPKWRYVERAMIGMGGVYDLIEVPRIVIAGIEFGPVWFTWLRGADHWSTMSDAVGFPVRGALGGSALHHFTRITVDYVNRRATFQK